MTLPFGVLEMIQEALAQQEAAKQAVAAPPAPSLPPVLGAQAPPQPPDQGGGGFLADLFGGSSGANLSSGERRNIGRNALFQAGLSTIEGSAPRPSPGSIGGFTPSGLEAIVAGLRGGQETFATEAQALTASKAEQAAQEALAESSQGTIDEQILGLRKLQRARLASGTPDDMKAVDTIEEIIQNMSPKEAFSLTSVGDGLALRLNRNTGEVALQGERSKDFIRTTVYDPELDAFVHAFFNKNDPTEKIVTDEVAALNKEDGTLTEVRARAKGVLPFANSSVRDFGGFYGVDMEALGDAPITAEMIKNQPAFLPTVTASVDPFGTFREIAGIDAQIFVDAQEAGIEAVGRFLTGAAITGSEETRFKKLLPRLGEAPEVVASKLNRLRQLRDTLEEIANVGSGTDRIRILRARGLGDVADIIQDARNKARREGRLGEGKDVPPADNSGNRFLP